MNFDVGKNVSSGIPLQNDTLAREGESTTIFDRPNVNALKDVSTAVRTASAYEVKGQGENLTNRQAVVLESYVAHKTDENNGKNTLPIIYSTAIINNDQDIDTILGNEVRSNSKAKVYHITNYNDLSEDELISKHRLDKNSITGETDLVEENGSLFIESDDPVVLVLDYTEININTIVQFNSLYDHPPTLHGIKLASNVKIISVVDANLSDAQGPGNDFWRRVLATGDFIDTNDAEYAQGKVFFDDFANKLVEEADEPDLAGKEDLIIRLAGKNWRNELFGHLDLDESNNLCYKDGILSKLTGKKRVYFQDAPLDDKNFAIEISKVINDGGYTANGKYIKLPDEIKFHQCKTDENKLKKLQDKFRWDIPENQSDQTKTGQIKTINDISFFSYMQEAAVKDRRLIKHDVFKEWIGEDTSVIRVTTRLSENQWYVLLRKLEELEKTDICIIQDDPYSQPPSWIKENKFQPKEAMNNNIKIVLDDLGFIPNTVTKKQEDKTAPLIVQLSPDSYVTRLTSKINKISLKDRYFDMESTDFLRALEAGIPIEIYGLNYNPKLICELETLLCDPPHLIVDGFVRTFPNAKINFHLPNETNLPTAPWKNLKQNAEQVYVEALNIVKTKLVKKYYEEAKIEKKLSSDAFDTIVKIVEEANTVIKIGKAPHEKVVLCEYFFNKIWKQAILEQQLDGAEKINKSHFQKALNSIFVKRHRDDPEQYRYIKFLVEKHFSVIPSSIDLIGLQHWIKKQRKINKEVIKNNFWILSQYIPLGNLNLKESIFRRFKTAFTLANIKQLFTIKSLVTALEHIISAVKKLLLSIMLSPYYIGKIVYKVSKYCYMMLSRIIPWMETRYPQETLRIKEKKTISLKDAVIAGSEALDFVFETIVAAMEDGQQKSEFQAELGISDKKILKHKKVLEKYSNNCYQVEKILRDICYSVNHNELDTKTQNEIAKGGYQKFCHKLSTNITKKIVEFKNTKVDEKETTKTRIIAEINELLKTILPADKDKEARAEFSAELLLCAEQDTTKLFWDYWFKRRKIRCASRLKTHPFIMIKGYSGAGKSYIAKEVAKSLNPNEEPIVVNVKADMSTEDIYESPELKNREITYIEGKLRQWAAQKGEDYHTLILDEFTLTNELWDGLKTMGDNPPYINVDGEKIPLTDKHRIIMTSNPDYFTGRKANKVLTSMTAEMFYFPLAEGFQKQQVIAPIVDKFIDRIKFSTDINKKKDAVDKITTCMHDIYTQYRKIIPDYEFTPRDLTDCCSRMETYFSDYITGENKDEITIEMIYSVVRESMKQSTANAVPDELSENVKAIDIWHKARFPGDDKIIKQMDERYRQFYDNFELFLRQNEDKKFQKFDLNNRVTNKLCRVYFAEIQRLLLEVETKQVHGGRHSILVKSSPGQGKDTLWLAVVNYFTKQCGQSISNNSYTADHKSMDEICNQTSTKFNNGGTISVSEFNAYDSQTIEGRLNDLFTDRPLKPGFLFLATINNEKETRGRNKLSPALLSRFTQSIIEDYDFNDFENICKTQVKNSAHAVAITKIHWRVISAMKKAKKNALPSLADIQKVAVELEASDPSVVSEEDLSKILMKNYSKYLQLIGYNSKKITEFFTSEQMDDEVVESDCMSNLTEWINKKTDSKLDSILVSKSIITGYNADRGIVYLSKVDQEKSIDEQKKIVMDTINNQLFGAATTEDKVAAAQLKTETQVEDTKFEDAKVEGANTEIPTVNQPKTQIASHYSGTVTASASKVSSVNGPVDPDVKAILESKEGVFKYGCIPNTFPESKILNRLANKLYKVLDKAMIDYYRPQVNEYSSVMLEKYVIGYGLSETSNHDSDIRLYNVAGADGSLEEDYLNYQKIRIPKLNHLKKLAGRALAELQNNKILEEQHTKELLDKHKTNKADVLAMLQRITGETKDFYLESDKELATFKLLSEINSPVCNMLCCSILTLRESFQWIDSFTSAIASGNINSETAIALLETKHNTLIKVLASRGVLYKCCETLKEGRNIENISAIVKHLLKKEGDYFDSKTLYSLLEIADLHQLEELSKEIKTVLDKRYQTMLSNEIKITAPPEQLKSEIKDIEKDIEKDIPPEATKLLTSIIKTNLNKTMKTDVKQVEVSTFKPTGKLDIPNFLAGKPPYKDVITQTTFSREVMVIGSPTQPTIRSAAIFYHKPSNQILDFGCFLFDEIGRPKFMEVKPYAEDDAVFKKLIEEMKEYLKSMDIDFTRNDKNFLSKLIEKLSSLYITQLGKYDFRSSELSNQTHYLSHYHHSKSIQAYLDDFYKGQMIHIPSTYISRLIPEQMLQYTGKLKFCLKFSHSSEVGIFTVNNVNDLRNLIRYVNDTTRKRLLLHICNPHDEKEYQQKIMPFEKEKIKQITGNDNLALFHQQDLENLVSSK